MEHFSGFWIDQDLEYIMKEERSLSYNKYQSYFYNAVFLNYGEIYVVDKVIAQAVSQDRQTLPLDVAVTFILSRAS